MEGLGRHILTQRNCHPLPGKSRVDVAIWSKYPLIATPILNLLATSPNPHSGSSLPGPGVRCIGWQAPSFRVI